MTTETSIFDLTTDKLDYAPGDIALFTLTGVDIGGSVEFQVLHVSDPGDDGVYGTSDDTLDAGPDGATGTADDGYGTTGAGHDPFVVTDGGAGDLDGVANGTIVTDWYVNPDDSLDETFLLAAEEVQAGDDGLFGTADDVYTGEGATTSFTDAGGAYTLNFAAADPSIYLPPIPFPSALGTDYVPGGRGDGSALISLADFNNGTSDVRVESLAPQDMALGQIVPFETEISVSGATTPENGVITFVIGWNTLTTNSGDFGYDARVDDIGYGVIEAFIDTSDGAHNDPGDDAQVDSFTWSVINDEIVGVFTVSGLDNGDVVVLEPWLVLDDTIPEGIGGNVQSRLIDAATGGDQSITVANSGAITLDNGDAISTGNQTVPLLKPSDFFNADVDLSISKTDDVDPIETGDTLTYTITASNAGPSVANSVVIYDELDPNVTFVSASDDGFINTDAGDTIPDGAVQWDVGALAPGDTVVYTLVVTVNNDAPTAGTEDLNNTVTVTTISNDTNLTNNTDTEPTNVSAPVNILDDLDESVTTNEDTPVSGNVLDNTDNPDGPNAASVTTFQVAGDATVYNAGDTATIADVGTLVIGSDGAYTFTPEPNYDGPVPQTTYTVTDGIDTNDSTLDIAITPVNDLDDLDESVTTNEDTPVSGNVLDNTDNPDGPNAASVTTFQVAGDATVYNAGDTATIADVGTLVIGSDGAYTFTPEPNYDGPVPQTTYTVTDGIDTNDSTLDIAITPVNDLDDLDESVTTNEDTPVSGNVLDNTDNPDGPNAASVTTFQVAGDATVYNAGDTATIADVGTLVIGSDGAYTFTPEPNYDGPVPQTTYTVTDGIDTNDSTLDIAITPVNDLDDLDESVTTNEDTPVSGNVLDNTDNPDGGPASVTTFQVAGDATVYNAGDTATITGVGTLVIGSDGAYTFTPAEDYDGAVPQTTYTVSDGIDTNDSTLDITITPVNDLDDLDESVTTNEDTPVSGNVLDNTDNPDGGPASVTTFQVAGDATVYTAGDTATITGVGTLVIGSDGAYTFTPAEDYDGAVPQTTYTVSDGIDTNDSTLDIAITPVNDLDDLDESVTTNEDTPVSGNVLDNTDNPDGPNAASVTTFQVAGDATVYNAGDTATIAGVGTLVIGSDGSYTFTPADDYNGPVPQTTYTVTDGADTNDSTLDISITPVNDLPTAADDSYTVEENSGTTTLTPAVTADDDFGGDGPSTGTIAIATNPTSGTVTVNDGGTPNDPTDDTFDYAPNADFSGSDSFTYTITDADGDQSTATVDITVDPVAISIIKTGVFNDEGLDGIAGTMDEGEGDGFANVGETISYAFTVANEGNVTLTDVTVADEIGGVTMTGGPTTLDVGETDTTTFTGSYTLTQVDIDAGEFENQALASGTSPIGNTVTDLSDDDSPLQDEPTNTPLPQDPAISIIKTSVFNDENGDGDADPGETISYAFTVANEGNVTLTNVTVTDPLLVAPDGSLIGGPIASLAVGASDSTTFTGSYTIDQADIDAGTVDNQALATGTDPNGVDVTDLSDDNSPLEDDETMTPLPQNPAISIIKTSVFNDENGDGDADPGETISYAFTVANEGNVTLTNVTVTDPLLVAPDGSLIGGPIASLAVGASDSTTFTGSYTIDQADIDAGTVDNQALATGTDPNGVDVTDLSDDNSPLEDDETMTPLPQNPAISIIKTSVFNDENGDGDADPGETISYAFTVANEGNVTLTNVTVTDPLLVAPDGSLIGGPIASLAVGASDSTTFTGSYTIDQADIDAGTVDNQALATGTDPNGVDVTDLSDDNSPLEDDETMTPLPQNPAISIIKTSVFNDENGDGDADPGETISYAFTVANEGNVTLTNVTVTDPLLVAPDGSLIGGPIASLAVGASDSTTFTGSYTIDQADIDAGTVDNQALATGTDPNGVDVTDLSDDNSPLEDDETMTPLPQNPAISIIKTSVFNDENGDGDADPGETISYAFTVANEGNVTLTNVTVTDPLLVAPDGSLIGGPIASLAVGASDSTTFTGSYTIDQADIDAGTVDNQALATGTDPNGVDVTDLSDDNSPLEDDETMTPLPQNPAISIIKTSVFNDENGDGDADPGETISYAFTVANEGNVTLTNVTVTDPLLVAPDGSLIGGPIASLAVGASDSTTFTGSYTIDQADIDAGTVDNQALATGTDPNGVDVTDLSDDNSPLEDDETMTPLPQNPAISIIKTSVFNDENGDGDADPGETISYAFTVANEGNVTLTNVTVTDPLLVAPDGSLIGGPIASLAVGASDSTTFTGSYTIDQADIDAGTVDNQALATGTDPNGVDVTDLSDDNSPLEDDETMTPLPQNPAISIIKTSVFNDENGDGDADPGETISYAFTVANEGNVTLTNVTVTDPLLVAPDGSLIGGPIASLAVGASDSTTFTGSYTIDQADIDAGTVDNQALATGTDPNGVDVTDLSDDNSPLEDDETMTPLPQNPAISIIKTSVFNDENGDGDADPGETISYAFTVANEGNVTLTNVTVTDPLLVAPDGSLIGGPIASLAVGASDSTTFTGSYTIDQADIDAGTVDNQALATGTDPNGVDVTDLSDDNSPLEDDETMTPLPQNPAISIVKDFAGDEQESVIAGDLAGSSFTLVVTNTGNVTLSDALIEDNVDSHLQVTGVSGTAGADADSDANAQTVEWLISSLAPGQSETITANFVVDASVEEANGVGGVNDAANVLNTASAAAEAPQGDPGDQGDDITDDDTDDIDILTEIELSIDKTFYRIDDRDTNTPSDDIRLEDGTIEQGTTGYFELAVSNNGPSDALDVLVTDTVAPSLEVVRVFNDLNNNDIWDSGEELADFDGDGIGDFGASDGQNIEGTFDLAFGATATISVEYEAAPFLDPDVSLFGTQEGDDFKFVFVNGYILEGSSDPNSTDLDGDGLHEVFLTAPDGTVTEIVYDGTKNEYNFDPPELPLYENGSLVVDENGAPVLFDDPEFTMHLSCSDPFTGGWGSGGGTNGPEEGVDVNWQIASASILRYNNNGNFFKGCGDTVVPADVPNTAFADGADSNSLLGTDELVSGTDTVQVIRQLKIDTRSDLVFKGKKADILLFNTGKEALTIEEIKITWPDANNKNGDLVEVLFGGNTIYDTRESTEPLPLPDEDWDAILDDDDGDGSPWVGTVDDRTIDPLEGLKLGFFFAKKVDADAPYEISVTLEGELTSEVLNITANQTNPLTLDAEPLTGGNAELLTQTTLAPVVDAAIDYWAEQGVDAEGMKALLKTDIRIEDLGGSQLGETDGLVVTLDDDAAGYGWSDALNDADADQIDLLSALTHEFGHVLGFEHDVMGETLGGGERDLPLDGVGDASDDANLSHLGIEGDLLFG